MSQQFWVGLILLTCANELRSGKLNKVHTVKPILTRHEINIGNLI